MTKDTKAGLRAGIYVTTRGTCVGELLDGGPFVFNAEPTLGLTSSDAWEENLYDKFVHLAGESDREGWVPGPDLIAEAKLRGRGAGSPPARATHTDVFGLWVGAVPCQP